MERKIHILVATLLAFFLPVTAADFYVNGLAFELPDGPEGETAWVVEGCSERLTDVVIPGSVYFEYHTYRVTGIGWYAFYNHKLLTSVSIPASVTSIDSEAFVECSGLESIVVASDNPSYDSRDNCNAVIKKSNNVLIVGCKNTVIPNSVTQIGDCAFAGCSQMTAIDIPSSVTHIGSNAFYDCSSLTQVAIPDAVTQLGSDAFSFCSGLTHVTIGSSVSNVGSGAFCYCSELAEITSRITDVNNVVMGRGVFVGVTNPDCTLRVPAGTVSAYSEAEQWSSFNILGDDGEEFRAGDVNRSGTVDGSDVNEIINIVLGNADAANYKGRADLDHGGTVDGGDINRLINIILTK